MPGGPADRGAPGPVAALARGGHAYGLRSGTTVRVDTFVVDLAGLVFIDCTCLSVVVRHCGKIRCQGSIPSVTSPLTWFEVYDTPGRPPQALACGDRRSFRGSRPAAEQGRDHRGPGEEARVVSTGDLPVLAPSTPSTAMARAATAWIWPDRYLSGAARLQASVR